MRVGSALRVALAMTNRDTIDMRCTAALFAQTGAVRFVAETDRVYEATVAACTIDDPVLNRRIHILKQSNHSTVAWSPWVAKEKG